MTKSVAIQRRLAALFSGTVLILGFLGSCDDKLVGLTGIIDPCGTILGNCLPGQIQAENADIGDYCIDPGCTLPGACGLPPLGTIYNLCKSR